MSYHGVQNVYDEWGRPILAQTIHYAPMRFSSQVAVSVSGQMAVKSNYSANPTEYLFDLADGRFMGTVDIDHSQRVFSHPSLVGPVIAGYYESPLMSSFLALAANGRPSQRMDFWRGYPGDSTVSLEEVDFHPLAGDCTAFEIVMHSNDHAAAKVELDHYGNFACFGAGDTLPIWAWTGYEEGEHVAITRTGPDIRLAALAGQRLAPVDHARHPWEAVSIANVTQAVMVPPSGTATDYASALRLRMEALLASPSYQGWAVTQEGLYLRQAFTGLPSMGCSFGGLPGLPPIPSVEGLDTSLLTVSPGRNGYQGNVHKQPPAAEGGDSGFVSDPCGAAELDDSIQGYPVATELPDLVAASEIRDATKGISPALPERMEFFVLRQGTGKSLRDLDMQVVLQAIGSCNPNANAPYAQFSLASGRLLLAGNGPGAGLLCKLGDSWKQS